MLFKMAFRNTRKSFGDFTVYFLTLMFGVAAFYAFGSIESQKAMFALNSASVVNLQRVGTVMDVISVVVAVILALLVVYANGFLLRRRKREFGTYLMLGMPKRQVAFILIVETTLVGVAALAAGLVAGTAASQGLSLITASLFELDMTAYRFVFSPSSLVKTVGFFGAVFATVSVLNLLGFSRHTVSQLLNASKRSEPQPRNQILSTSLALAGLVMVGRGCWLLLNHGLLESISDGQIWIQILLGTLGTLLLFAGGSGLVLRILQSSKTAYLRGLNPFVIRQLDSKIVSTFATMSVACITLFFAIVIFSGGFTYANVLSKQVSAPYDATFEYGSEKPQSTSISKGMAAGGIAVERLFARSHEFAVYESPVTVGDILPSGSRTERLDMITESDANALLALQGEPRIELGADEFALFVPIGSLDQPTSEQYRNLRVDVAGHRFAAAADGMVFVGNAIGSGSTLVVPDQAVRGSTRRSTVLNVMYAGDGVAAEQAVVAYMQKVEGQESAPFNYATTKRLIVADTMPRKVIATYVGLYIGLILMVTAAVILALQQLSEATDNRRRYKTLSKLGADDKMMGRAVFTQVAAYFGAPLAMALIYSLVGGKAVLEALESYGAVIPASDYSLVIIAVAVVYGGYFVATVLTARRIALGR